MNVYVNFNFISIFVAQVFLSNVSPTPPPVSAAAHFNPLITSTALPLPHTRSGKSGSCEYGQIGHHLAVIPVRSLYKQPQFTGSSVVPVEFWKSTPPSLQSWLLHCHFFSCITQSK